MNNANLNYPQFHKNLQLEEFYENKKKESLRKKTGKSKPTKKYYLGYFVTLILLLALIPSIYLANTRQELRGKAAPNGINTIISLYPAEIIAKKRERFSFIPQIVNNNSLKISSVLMSIAFDKSHVKYIGMQPPVGNDNMKYLKTTLPDIANNSGLLKFLAGAVNFENAPAGVAHLLPVNFEVISEGKSNITLVKSSIQVTFTNGQKEEINSDSKVSVDSIPKISPVPTSTPALTTINTPTPTPVPILLPPSTPTAIQAIPTITLMNNPTSVPTSPAATITETLPNSTASAGK